MCIEINLDEILINDFAPFCFEKEYRPNRTILISLSSSQIRSKSLTDGLRLIAVGNTFKMKIIKSASRGAL